MKAGRLLSVVLTLVFPVSTFFAEAGRCATPSEPSSTDDAARSAGVSTASIPGPLRSFLRMAGISQKVSSDEVMPLLARNVFVLGYEGRAPKGRPAEFLVLLTHYVQQARELSALAGPLGVLHVSNCEEAKPLLRILGYRTRQDCGQPNSYLETADAQRAFLTIDSGFPLPDLEKSLQEGHEFRYAFPVSQVPAPLVENDWVTRKEKSNELVDMLLGDPGLARFYWALARMDSETQESLRHAHALKKLVPYAPILDFYGSHLRIRAGHVVVPGGSAASASWKDLAGASPDSPGDFVPKLFAKDNGWLAAYFDALSRATPSQQAHFTESGQLRRYYEMLRGKDTMPEAGTGVFRHDSGLFLMVTRLRWEANGDPYVPGNLDVWKKVFRQKSDFKTVREWGHRSVKWEKPTQLLEALFAVSRVQTDSGPLQSYLAISELDARRSATRLKPETVALLASKYYEFSDQYLVFSEFPELDDASITSFINAASGLDGISKTTVRGNALGMFQATTGLWQILARQGEIPNSELNASWQRVLKPYNKINTSAQVFDAGRASLKELLLASTGKPDASQDRLIHLLAGPRQDTPEGQRMHDLVAERMRAVLDEQRLISLDTILALGDGLHEVAQVRAEANTLLPLAAELREFEMPQPIFKNSEREQWAAGIYNNHHTEMQMRTDLSKVIKAPSTPEQLAEARGQLASFLRDSLVGLNYAYYEPPGSQILHHNPLFIRSHDFSGETVIGLERVWQAPQLFGAGSPAGGGAHLVGSLADLPYVLANAEQDFITPENVQALIWRELVPGLLTNAVVPRWWNVSRSELHAVTLYQRSGEELLKASAQNEQLRGKVMEILSDRMVPERSVRVEDSLQKGEVEDALTQLMPADTFYLAVEYQRRYPQETEALGEPGKELEALAKQSPEDVSWERLSRDFGVPHRMLAQSYARELLNLPPFPVFMGYSSRLLAESWDSNNIYWARLADEKGYSPVLLNRLVPELTHRMVEKIFATDFEDWPALLRAARETGEEFREGKITALSRNQEASPQR